MLTVQVPPLIFLHSPLPPQVLWGLISVLFQVLKCEVLVKTRNKLKNPCNTHSVQTQTSHRSDFYSFFSDLYYGFKGVTKATSTFINKICHSMICGSASCPAELISIWLKPLPLLNSMLSIILPIWTTLWPVQSHKVHPGIVWITTGQSC